MEKRRRKSRSESEEEAKEMVRTDIIIEKEMEKELEEEEEEGEEEEKCGFFACYLLTSLSPSHKGRPYIGFTVNPRRRIRQHNGEIRSGAWRTKRGRPWEMVLCIYGFPSNVSALQFEWAWQHPTESLAVRKAASDFKSLSGIANKLKLAYTMLNLPSWENLNLTVNFFSTKYMKHTGWCPKLPKQMRVNVCVMDELPCYVEGQIMNRKDDDGDNEDNYDEKDGDNEDDYDEKNGNGDVNLSTESDMSVKGFKGCDYPLVKASSHLSNWSNLQKEPYFLAESPKPSEECNRIKSNRTSSLGNEEKSFRWLQGSVAVQIKQPSSLRYSDKEEPNFRSCSLESPTCEEHSFEELQEQGMNPISRHSPLRFPNNTNLLPPPEMTSKSFSPCRDIWLQGSRSEQVSQPPSPRCSDTLVADNLLLPPEINVINLVTPSSGIVGKCGKRVKVHSEIIDLTDSPVIIQL